MRYLTLREAISYLKANRLRLVALDFEAWERNNNIMTEIGLALYDPVLQTVPMQSAYGNGVIPEIRAYHMIISEHKDKRNGRFVPDHKENFSFGISYVMEEDECVDALLGTLGNLMTPSDNNIFVLVAHSVSNEIKFLKKLGMEISDNVYVLDTCKLFEQTGAKFSNLDKVLSYLRIPHGLLHNAGNDAYYTLLLALCLCNENFRLKYQLDTIVPELTPRMMLGFKGRYRKNTFSSTSDEVLSHIFAKQKY